MSIGFTEKSFASFSSVLLFVSGSEPDERGSVKAVMAVGDDWLFILNS